MLNEIGRVCMKIAGRDAGGRCVIVDILDKNYVLVDGEVRRKKVNITHLEPLDAVVKIRKGASHEDVMAALQELMPRKEKAEKPKAKKEKPAKTKKR